jgi:hypothetical protein
VKRLLVLALLLGAPTPALAEDDFGGGSIVFAREKSLWKTDPKGKGPAVELVALPGAAADVRMIRTDPAGTKILFDLGGTWWWAAIDPGATSPAQPTQLPCADAPARLSADARMVVCAADDGKALLISLVTKKRAKQPIAADGVRAVVVGKTRDLIWTDADGVWRAPIGSLKAKKEVAPDAPVRGFLAAPDGSRGVATYAGHVYEKKEKVPGESLDGFALDGTAARRALHREGVVVDWSWDSTWVLVQAGDEACITRAVGGEYKCWKNYTAVSLAPDGSWAVLLGDRKEDDTEARSVYRGKLAGAYTERPSLVETVIDGGGALWLPGAP